jgi:hypothetical protein
LILLALVAYLHFRGDWVESAPPLLALLVYSTALYMAIAVELRYGIPFTPLLTVLGAYGFVNVAAQISSFRAGRTG